MPESSGSTPQPTGPSTAGVDGPLRVTAILTVFNRVELTLECLRRLHAQDAIGDRAQLSVVLVDDNSSDGTAERVAEEFPQVRLLHGDGSCFWAGGMRKAWIEAWTDDPDITFWVNDDTMLDPDALTTLLDTLDEVGRGRGPEATTIVAGATTDPDTGEVNYSGVRQHPWRRLRFDPVIPTGRPQQADTMNGNAVLVPRGVASRLGIISRAYVHSMGDYDYGMRARLAGCEVWVTPKPVGTTGSNPGFVPTGDVREDWRELSSVKHLPQEGWPQFAKRWAGPLWPLYWAFPYVRRMGWVVRQAITRG